MLSQSQGAACCKNVPHSLRDLNDGTLQSLGGGNPESRHLHSWSLQRHDPVLCLSASRSQRLSLAHRWPSPWIVHHLPSTCTWFFVQISTPYKDTGHIGLCMLKTSFYMDYFCKDLISKKVGILTDRYMKTQRNSQHPLQSSSCKARLGASWVKKLHLVSALKLFLDQLSPLRHFKAGAALWPEG